MCDRFLFCLYNENYICPCRRVYMCMCTRLSQGEDEMALRQCYEGVERDGEVIHVRDTVLLRSGPRKKSLPYVAKISALWEDPKTGKGDEEGDITDSNGQAWWMERGTYRQDCLPVRVCVCVFTATGEVMMSLFWYYRPEHTQGGRDPSAHCEVRVDWLLQWFTVSSNNILQNGFPVKYKK